MAIRKTFWDELDEMGEAKVREAIGNRIWNSAKREAAQQWLDHHASSKATSGSASMIAEARSANAIARLSAAEARTSNRIAIIALTIAIISAIASNIDEIRSFLGVGHADQAETQANRH